MSKNFIWIEKTASARSPRVSGRRKDGRKDRVERTERQLDRKRREVADMLVLPRLV